MSSPNPLIIFLAKPATQGANNVAAVPINAVNTGGFQPGITVQRNSVPVFFKLGLPLQR